VRSGAILGIVGVLAAAWLGCGGSDGGEPEGPTPAEAKAAREAEAQAAREAREQREVAAEVREEEKQRKKEAAKAKPAPEPEPQPGEAPAKFTGPQADRYETDYFICESAGTSKVAKEFGVPGADEVAAAEAYADGYRADLHQAAFEGCLDGLLGS
jgi:hypothetical protein